MNDNALKNVNFNAIGLKANGLITDEVLYDGDVVVVVSIDENPRASFRQAANESFVDRSPGVDRVEPVAVEGKEDIAPPNHGTGSIVQQFDERPLVLEEIAEHIVHPQILGAAPMFLEDRFAAPAGDFSRPPCQVPSGPKMLWKRATRTGTLWFRMNAP